MGKKQLQDSRVSPYYCEPRKMIRLAVSPDEYHAIRVRAAEAHLSMAEFCRRAAVEASQKKPSP